jgi:hypothetical protein
MFVVEHAGLVMLAGGQAFLFVQRGRIGPTDLRGEQYLGPMRL